MVNLNRKQRDRAGDFFEKSATGMLIGTALASATAGAGALAIMAVFATVCFGMAIWIERSRTGGGRDGNSR